MNTLLIFFAFPIAVIIVSWVLQKLLNNPIAVASLIFATFLVITFAFFDETFLIATLVYTILSFLTAFITKVNCEYNNSNNDNEGIENGDPDCESIGNSSTVQTISSTLNSNNNSSTYGYRYNRYRRY